MSNKEEEIANNQDESILSVPDILNNSDVLLEEGKTVIEDFTANGIFVDEEGTVFSKNKIEDDPMTVYMSSIIDQIESINNNLREIKAEKNRDRIFIEELQKKLTLNNINEAKVMLNKHLPAYKIKYNDVIADLVHSTWPQLSKVLINECLMVQDNLLKIKETHFKLLDAYNIREDESKRLKTAIYEQNKENMQQVESLASENDKFKENLSELLKKYGQPSQLKSGLTVDLLDGCGSVMKTQRDKIRELEGIIFTKNQEIDDLTKRIDFNEISMLTDQIEGYKATQAKLQDENISFSDTIQKITEKNVKLKKDLYSYNTELRKSMEVIKRKSETIQRQKTLIEMFQEKMLSGKNYPIDNLRRKKDDLMSRMEIETDLARKQSLEKEIRDCDRRLSDFLEIYKK